MARALVVLVLALALVTAGCATSDPAPPLEDDDQEPPAEGGNGEHQEPLPPDEGNGSAGDDQEPPPPEDVPMKLTSPAFEDNATIPVQYTGDGEDTSPPLRISEPPEDAVSLALIVDDPDAPRPEPWVHWLIWNLPAEEQTIPEGYPPSGPASETPGAVQGNNSWSSDNLGYRGPAPPERSGVHHYRFQLLALDTELDLAQGADRAQLEAAMDGHVLASATLTGVYER